MLDNYIKEKEDGICFLKEKLIIMKLIEWELCTILII